jgi:hypothetical protein
VLCCCTGNRAQHVHFSEAGLASAEFAASNFMMRMYASVGDDDKALVLNFYADKTAMDAL